LAVRSEDERRSPRSVAVPQECKATRRRRALAAPRGDSYRPSVHRSPPAEELMDEHVVGPNGRRFARAVGSIASPLRSAARGPGAVQPPHRRARPSLRCDGRVVCDTCLRGQHTSSNFTTRCTLVVAADVALRSAGWGKQQCLLDNLPPNDHLPPLPTLRRPVLTCTLSPPAPTLPTRLALPTPRDRPRTSCPAQEQLRAR